MIRMGRLAFVAAAIATTLLSLIPDDALARGGGFRFHGRSAWPARPHPYGALRYGYDGFGTFAVPALYAAGSRPVVIQSAPAPLPPYASTCRHSQDTVTVPVEDGPGTQQIRITRC